MHAARDRRVGPQGRPEQAVGPLERPHELLQDRALWPSWGTVEREASGGDELLQCSHGHRRHIGAGKKEVVDVPVHVGACGRCAAVRFARLDAPQKGHRYAEVAARAHRAHCNPTETYPSDVRLWSYFRP